MRHPAILTLCIAGSLLVSACGNNEGAAADQAIKSLNVIDSSNLNDLVLSSPDPGEAVTYFQNAVAENPTRMDLKRGLAKSLVKDDRPEEAVKVWQQIVSSPESTNDDRVGLADALIRSNDWKQAQAALNTIPPTYETFERYRLEAMVADSNKQWKKADSFYETAFGLTTKPSPILNNWGYSKLTRGDFAAAEKLFAQSLTYDPKNFTTKNNLVLARAAQGNYAMPVISMTQAERAQLLYTAGLSAVKQGDISTAKALLQEAVDTSPQYFEEADRALKTLNANVAN